MQEAAGHAEHQQRDLTLSEVETQTLGVFRLLTATLGADLGFTIRTWGASTQASLPATCC